MFSYMDDDLCLGMNAHNDEVTTMTKVLGDDTQLWKWQDGNVLVNKLGKVLAGVTTGDGKFLNPFLRFKILYYLMPRA